MGMIVQGIIGKYEPEIQDVSHYGNAFPERGYEWLGVKNTRN